MKKLIAITLLLGGCVSPPLSGTAPSPDMSPLIVPPQVGVYDVTVAAATGDCAPATLSGPLAPLQETIDYDQQQLRVQMPDVVLGKDALFATRALPGYHWRETTTRCGAQVAYDVTAIEIASDALTLVRSELWTNTAANTGAPDGNDATCDFVPPADCGSSVTLRYTLAEPCAAPCTLTVGDAPLASGFPAVSCVCAP
ncbi:MAG TPA: hypothetical protein VIA18_24545 [Polyangia bacterium]|jgi:hypothetical protein|nr:hypothetical protein [Polyangia bacterium]